MPPSLLSLPPELLIRITTYLPKSSNAAWRLVCHALVPVATSALFADLKLSTCGESVEAVRRVLEDGRLRGLVRRVEVDLCEGLEEYHEAWEAKEETKVPEGFYDVFGRLAEFPLLQALQVKFDWKCAGPDGSEYLYYPHNLEFRDGMMRRMVELLAGKDAGADEDERQIAEEDEQGEGVEVRDERRKNDDGSKGVYASNVRSLSIQFPQGFNNMDIVGTSRFRSCLSQLRALRLFVTLEDDEHTPEMRYLGDELYVFMEQLPSVWLSPAISTLTTLTLYCVEYFGYHPKLDLHGIHFPLLRSLAFGKYTFSHDWQVDWIISHASTLQQLILDNCPIIYKFSSRAAPDEEYYITDRDYDPYSPKTNWSYDKRWHHHFIRFREELPGLRKFRFGARPQHVAQELRAGSDELEAGLYSNPDITGFNAPELLPISLMTDSAMRGRYVEFYDDGYPTPYSGEGQYGFESQEGDEPNVEGLAEEDWKALCELLRGIGQPVPSTYEGDQEQSESSPDDNEL